MVLPVAELNRVNALNRTVSKPTLPSMDTVHNHKFRLHSLRPCREYAIPRKGTRSPATSGMQCVALVSRCECKVPVARLAHRVSFVHRVTRRRVLVLVTPRFCLLRCADLIVATPGVVSSPYAMNKTQRTVTFNITAVFEWNRMADDRRQMSSPCVANHGVQDGG